MGVMTWSIDRLGRSLKHLMEILSDLDAKNIDLYMDQQAIDTTTPSGKLMVSVSGSFSAVERELIRERVLSGLENARRKGRIGGRPTNLTPDTKIKILELKSKGVGIQKIAKECSVGIQTIYKVLKAA